MNYKLRTESYELRKVGKITLISFLIWASLLLVLSIIWYKGIFKGHFTFFDDSLEWLQMDKLGHFYASFQVSRWFVQILRWQKVPEEEAKRYGVWGGILFVSPIEILDGFSVAYGFSWSDILANVAGSVALWVQYTFFKRIRFMPKFSFLPSEFAPMRKEMLGGFFLSQLIKDYNAHTYWLSFSPNVFLKKDLLPPWLMVSVGLGAENLLGGHDNVWEHEGQTFDYSYLERSREVYLSLDVDFQFLQDDAYWKKALKLAFSCIKFPFPSIRITSSGLGIAWW